MLALGVCLPQPCSRAGRVFVGDHVCIATKQFVRFHKKEFDEMDCTLDSTENPRSFEKYPWGFFEDLFYSDWMAKRIPGHMAGSLQGEDYLSLPMEFTSSTIW